jgi:hypothetical protein
MRLLETKAASVFDRTDQRREMRSLDMPKGFVPRFAIRWTIELIPASQRPELDGDHLV